MIFILSCRYLAHGGPRYIYALKFKMATSTIGRIITETCRILWECLHEIYLSPPNREEWKELAKQYEMRWGLPHCLGAIDGKHINIVCPPNGGSQYYNFKGRHSIVFLAACDANYCFTMADIGAYGSQSDGGILAESSFGKLLFDDKLPIPPPSLLPNSSETFPYFFVGDNAFPLHPNLMRPFAERKTVTFLFKTYPTIKAFFRYLGNTSNPQERNFNKRISRARVTIENSFGILACRWRVLRNDIHAWPANVDNIIKATVLLHNFLMLKKCAAYCPPNYPDHVENEEIVSGQWRNEFGNDPLISVSASRSRNFSRERYNLRAKLSTYLANNP